MKKITSFPRISKIFWLVGLALLLAAGFLAQRASASQQADQTAAASPLHPTFALLDANSANVLESGGAVSTMATCGQCHDTAYIASHSFHVDLGEGEAPAAGAQPWETSPGLYGSWDGLRYRYLSPEGDSRPDLTSADWVNFNAARLVGGGPAGDDAVRDPDAPQPHRAHRRHSGRAERLGCHRHPVGQRNCGKRRRCSI